MVYSKHMKKHIRTIIAAIILVIIGIYLINQGQRRNDADAPSPRTEIINGEEVTLDYPYVESFSNATSNAQAGSSSGASSRGGTATTSYAAQAINAVTAPFTLGFYYLKNIAEIGLDGCVDQEVDGEDDDVDFPDYDEDNLTVTSVDFVGKSAFLFVDVDEEPEGLCATLFQHNAIPTNIIDAIHVIVN